MVRKGFLGGTPVTSIIFIKKAWIHSFLVFYLSGFVSLFHIIAICMHVKQRKIMRHKQNYDFCKKQII